MSDLYATLGVPRDATPSAIKAAYRQLAKQFHPDTNRGDESAAERFRAVQEAYDVLADDAARAHYDLTGEARPPRAEGGDPEAKLHSDAVLLLNEVLAVHQEPWKVDLVAEMIKLTVTKEVTFRAAIGQARGKLKRAERMQNRFRRKGGKANALDRAIADQIRALGAQVSRFDSALKELLQVREYLRSYEFDVEANPTAATHAPFLPGGTGAAPIPPSES